MTSIVLILTATAMLAPAAPTSAQVLEIGDGGAVTVHDRPAVYDARGETAIANGHRTQAPSGVTIFAAAPQALSAAADAAELSPDLVEAVAWRESRLRAGLVSGAGAVGEMQLMPGTARALGVDAHDTAQNYRGGAAYLRSMLMRYDGDLQRALAAYNAGPGAVDRYGGVPPFKETQAYVAAVMDRLSRRAGQADPSPFRDDDHGSDTMSLKPPRPIATPGLLLTWLAAGAAHAQSATLDPQGSGVILNAVTWLQGTLLGNVATALAVIAVGATGLMMLTGRIDWRRGATVIIGCFIVFGAAAIVAGIRSVAVG